MSAIVHPYRYLSSIHAVRPEYIHPFASAIDSPELKIPEKIVSHKFLLTRRSLITILSQVCIKLDSKPAYVRLPEGQREEYENYGPESLESWHKKNGLYVD